MSEGSRIDTVVIEFPARREFLLLARTVTTSVATSLGLDYETCDDLRLGVNELCTALIDGTGSRGPLRLELTASDETLKVTGTLFVAGGDRDQTIELDPIASQIVRTVGDHFEVGSVGSEHRFLLERHLAG